MLEIKDRYLQSVAASAAFAAELAEAFQKYGVKVHGIENIASDIVHEDRYNPASPVVDYRVRMDARMSFSFRDLQKCNPQLQMQGLSSPPRQEGRCDCPFAS